MRIVFKDVYVNCKDIHFVMALQMCNKHVCVCLCVCVSCVTIVSIKNVVWRLCNESMCICIHVRVCMCVRVNVVVLLFRIS